ncbi:MAG: hypothetical protein JW981_05955, partial [Anaerolineae bacterium]|nr:hypothetical protein [Anaerolineae bacterium]
MRRLLLTVCMLSGLIIGLTLLTAHAASPTTPDNATHPNEPVKLVFIHHSCGGNWLADTEEHDQAGGLGQALMDNNYFVSATNYGWGPGGIGTNTDIPNWPEWFTDTVMSHVYTEYAQNICGMGEYSDWCFGNWTRMADPNPAAENEIIMFKSCYPNSDLYGNPTDLPLAEPNDQFTVANAKAVYNHILDYFGAHQDKLFIVITAPPMAEG